MLWQSILEAGIHPVLNLKPCYFLVVTLHSGLAQSVSQAAADDQNVAFHLLHTYFCQWHLITCCTLLPMTLDNQTRMPLNAPGGDCWQGAEGNLHLSISLSLSVSSRSKSCWVITHKLTNCTHCCQCQGKMHKTEDRVKAEQHGGQCSSPSYKPTNFHQVKI